MKRKMITLTVALVLVCAMCATLLVGCNTPGDNNGEAKAKATTYVALDINPSVELILDEKNMVVSANGLNEDAKVMLYGEGSLKGLSVEAAAEKIGKLAAECNFVSGDNNTVNVTVAGASADATKSLNADISAGLNKGTGAIELKVNVGANFSLEREFAEFEKAHPEVKDINQYRLIKEAMEADPTLTLDVAISLDFDDLLERLEDAREDAIEAGLDMLPKAHKVALETAEDVYEAVVERMETVQYYKVALADADKVAGVPVLTNALTEHIPYIVYKNLEITLDRIEDAIEQIHEEADEYLKDADVEALFNALVDKGVLTEEKANAEKTELLGSDKKVTIDEMEAYLDIKLKNAKGVLAEDVLDEIEDVLDNTLDAVEEDIEAAMKNVPDSIKEDLKKLGDDIVIEMENALGVDLDVATKNIVTDIVNGFVNFNLKDVTVEKLEEMQDAIEEKAEEFEEKVEASMTKEQLKKVEDAKKAITTDSKVKAAYDEYVKAVNKAKAEAETYLKNAKADRKAK